VLSEWRNQREHGQGDGSSKGGRAQAAEIRAVDPPEPPAVDRVVTEAVEKYLDCLQFSKRPLRKITGKKCNLENLHSS
jgi:hypothetical protein